MNDFDRAYRAAHSSDGVTHAGHWALALLIFLVGWAFRDVETGVYGAAAAFVYREASDILKARSALGSWQAAIRAKGLDGYLDLFFALLGAATGCAWAFGGLEGLLAGTVASGGMYGIVHLWRTRQR